MYPSEIYINTNAIAAMRPAIMVCLKILSACCIPVVLIALTTIIENAIEAIASIVR